MPLFVVVKMFKHTKLIAIIILFSGVFFQCYPTIQQITQTYASTNSSDTLRFNKLNNFQDLQNSDMLLNAYKNDFTYNVSARKRIPASLQTKLKNSYGGTEAISIKLNNPDADQVSVQLMDGKNNTIKADITHEFGNGITTFAIAPFKQFKPGRYKIHIKNSSGNTAEQDFLWGVLAMNTNKSIYAPHEKANIDIAVLNEAGNMVCDADLTLRIQNSKIGIDDTLTTKGKEITINPSCHGHEFTLTPDYSASYIVGDVGNYTMTLTAKTANGTYRISDLFEVRRTAAFIVERTSATRIFPPFTYPVKFTITANEDFDGIIQETVPVNFTITPFSSASAETESYVQTDETTAYITPTPVLVGEEVTPTPELSPSEPPNQEMATREATMTEPNITMTPTLGAISEEEQTPFVLGQSTNFVSVLKYPFNGVFPITQIFGGFPDDPYLWAEYKKFGVIGHDGMDFGLPENTPVVAADSGNVIFADDGDYGKTVIIKHDWGKTYYGHLSEISIKKGKNITKGETLGLSGSTGLSTGPHLHFGVKPFQTNNHNGFYGKVDPMLYLTKSIGKQHLYINDRQKQPTNSLETTQISFPLKMKKGETTTLEYKYLAPYISPEFYTLGPLTFINTSNVRVFQELRQWQIASDAVWINTNWKFRKAITIDHTKVSSNQTNFPILINLTADAELATNARSDGFDIVFTDSTGNVKIPMEREKYNAGNKTNWCNTTTPVTCNSNWTRRQFIYFDNSAAATDLVNYPVMIKLTTSSFAFNHARADGYDIVFTDSNGTALNYERQTYNGTTTGTFWVNVPIIHAGSKTDGIWMYYGNASATNQDTATVINNTWDSNFAGVWHFEGSPIVDSKGARPNGTVNGPATVSYPSELSGNGICLPFNNASYPPSPCGTSPYTSNMYVSWPAISSIENTQHLTISTLINPKITTNSNSFGQDVLLGGPNWPTNKDSIMIQYRYDGNVYFHLSPTGGLAYGYAAGPGTGRYSLLTMVYDGTQTGNANRLKAYINGVQVTLNFGSYTIPATSTSTSAPFNLGMDYNYGQEIGNAAYDESRVSTVSRTADWVLADYKNLTNHFVTFGYENTYPGPQASAELVAWVKVPSISNTLDTVIYMYYGNPSSCDETLSTCTDIDGTKNATTVWDSNYLAVYHLQQTNGNQLNSTSNIGYDWLIDPFPLPGDYKITTQGSALGMINGADTFATTDQTKNTTNVALNSYTIEGWHKATSYPGTINALWANHRSTGSPSWYSQMFLIDSSNHLAAHWYNSSGTNYVVTSQSALTAGNWYFLATTSNGTMRTYINGAENNWGPVTTSGTVLTANDGHSLGGGIAETLDEFRISNIQRSASWLQTEYNNQSAPASFYTVGQQECMDVAPIDRLMRHGKWFNECGKQPYTW